MALYVLNSSTNVGKEDDSAYSMDLAVPLWLELGCWVLLELMDITKRLLDADLEAYFFPQVKSRKSHSLVVFYYTCV